MSNKNQDRLKRADNATDQVRKEVDEIVDESKDAGNEAREDGREAIDDVEARVKERRNVPTNTTSPIVCADVTAC